MTRAHRILSKADRDGTTRHIAPALERGDLELLSDRRSRFAWNPGDDLTTQVDDQPMPPPSRESAPPVAGRPVFGTTLDKDMVAALQPFSPAAEQYRTLRTRIAQVESAGQRRVILVTSPGDGDGKTVTAANLALTMAQEFQRQVLLIDSDLRNSRLHECLGIPREPGLSDVLAGQASLEDALVSLSEYRVIVLPAGSPHGRPTELLSSEPMRRLVENLGRRFDRVVMDSTAAHFADAGVLEPLVDGVLLVVRAGRTSRPAVGRALGLVPRAKLLGLVLNDSRATSR
ncbi:MAG: CpsD/CapB family tyrosine-protein kinase [Vicinamibacteraceae bacterium]